MDAVTARGRARGLGRGGCFPPGGRADGVARKRRSAGGGRGGRRAGGGREAAAAEGADAGFKDAPNHALATSSLDDGDQAVEASASSHSVMRCLEDALGSAIDYGPQVPPTRPLVLVISGPSGVGKDAVIKALQERRRDLHFVVTATSRARRPNEVDGVDYFFVSRERFEEMIANDELLEHAVVYGEYKGIPKRQVMQKLRRGQDVVLRLDVQGAQTVRELLPDAVFIFLVAESEAALVKRLMARKTEPLHKAIVRVQTARDELGAASSFDYVVVNRENELAVTVGQLEAILTSERLRVARVLESG